MKHILEDGRELVAAYDDIRDFFDRNHIAGRKIKDIRSAENDYMIQNLYDFDIEELKGWTTESGIKTDGQIAILFEDGDNFEIEFSGNGPVLLGFNTADFRNYPKYDGRCYKLSTLFHHCIGRMINEVRFGRSDKRMEFPAYCGIDMSDDDEGVQEIELVLDDRTSLLAYGSWDFYCFTHIDENREELRVPYTILLDELNPEVIHRLFVEHEGI